jgi:hypothetical protein
MTFDSGEAVILTGLLTLIATFPLAYVAAWATLRVLLLIVTRH